MFIHLPILVFFIPSNRSKFPSGIISQDYGTSSGVSFSVSVLATNSLSFLLSENVFLHSGRIFFCLIQNLRLIIFSFQYLKM